MTTLPETTTLSCDAATHTEGIVAAAVTAFRADGNVDLECVSPLALHLQRQGATGVFVNGTTGEGMSLSTDEREQLADAWRQTLSRELRLFIHVGHCSLPDAQRMAAHAQSIGADAVATMAPGFFKPNGIEGVVDWCAAIAASAPQLPFYYYHMPSMNGVAFRVIDFLASAADRIPNLAGVKFTFEALDDYMLCTRFAGGRFDILWGRDEMLLPGLAAGARGAVGSTYNVATPLYRKLVSAFNNGDFEQARAIQEQSCLMIQGLVATGSFFSALKHVLGKQGVPISPRVRQPLVVASHEKLAVLDELWAQQLLP